MTVNILIHTHIAHLKKYTIQKIPNSKVSVHYQKLCKINVPILWQKGMNLNKIPFLPLLPLLFSLSEATDAKATSD